MRTDGPDGKLADFEVKYTFGVHPLQQYLVELPGGRLQALGIAWDARPAQQRGQRWFHLYPERKLKPGDPLHWTGIDQVWNYQCADCHSTNLRKNYDEKSNSYATQWTDINVTCEACHGPGSNHVAWARKEAGWERLDAAGKGLAVALDERRGASWSIGAGAGNAVRSTPRAGNKLILESLRGVMGNGAFSASGSLEMEGEGLDCTCRITGTRLQLAQLLQSIAPERKEEVSGVADLALNMQGRGATSEAFKKNLTGKGNFTVTDGKISNLHSLESLANFIKIDALKTQSFDESRGTFTIGDGAIRLESSLKGKEVELYPVGTIGLDSALDIALDMRLVPQLSDQIAGAEPSARLLPREEARRTYDEIVRRLRDPALLEFAAWQAVRSSGFPVLDDAAVRIVKLASPFAPFPPEIGKDTDVLDITRTWQFTSSNRLFSSR